MNYARASDTSYIVRLDPGDELLASVAELCTSEGIDNASVSGIGSLDSPTLAHYRKDKKAYSEQVIAGIVEAASLTGNVGIYEGKPLAHIHAVVSDESMSAHAGHVVSAKCSATVELVITKQDSALTKAMNDEIGLKLWELD